MGRRTSINASSGSSSSSGSATLTQAEKDAIVAEAKRGGVFLGSYGTIAAMPTTGVLSGDYATLSAQDGTNAPGDYTYLDIGFGAQWFPKSLPAAGTVTAAGAYTITTDRVYVNPTASLATWVPTMPTGTDGRVVEIYFGGTLATGTVVVTATWPNTIIGAAYLPTEWMAGEAISFRFSSDTGKWHGMS